MRTSHFTNPKSEYRNPKQFQNPNFKIQKFFVLGIYILITRACFELIPAECSARASDFEFIYLSIYFSQNDVNAPDG